MIKFDKIFKKDKFNGICILPIGRDCHNSMMLRRLGMVLSIEKILTEKVVVTATEEEENEN